MYANERCNHCLSHILLFVRIGGATCDGSEITRFFSLSVSRPTALLQASKDAGGDTAAGFRLLAALVEKKEIFH